MKAAKAKRKNLRLHRMGSQKPVIDRQEWSVVDEVFQDLQRRFAPQGFDVDATCDAMGSNRKVERYWSDCLREQWRGLRVWCNPPYSDPDT